MLPHAFGFGAAMSLDAHPYTARSDYREFPVPPELADHFLCLWTQAIAGSQSEYAHRVLPDGCIDIVFINDEPPVVVGPWTDPFVARFSPGTKIVGARIHPGRAPSVLGAPSAELLNRSVPLSAMWDSRKLARLARIPDESDLAARRSLLAEALCHGLASATPPDQTVVAGIQWFAHHPHGRVERLSQWIGISNRQLQRRFAAAVGYGPKMFQSVLRFQRLLNCAGRKAARYTLAELALNAGYTDQAHMTREVRRFANCPPTVLLRSAECTLRLSDLFKTGDLSPNHL